MKPKLKQLLALIPFILTPLITHGEIITEEVEYATDEVTMKGFIAYDNSITEKRPAILVVHEWWGQNPYARHRAVMLAELGYTALAVDMYGEGKQADHPSEAGAFSGEVMSKLPEAKARFLAALDLIKNHPTVNPEETAAIGYCFGGSVVLNMALAGVELDAVASFHGGFSILYPTEKDNISASILICNGADDPFSKPEDIGTFTQKMAEMNLPFTLVNYDGAVHSFTNPNATENGEKFGLPLAYNETADKASWNELKLLLKSTFPKD